MATWDEFNKIATGQSPAPQATKSWEDFNRDLSYKAFEQEAINQKDIDRDLFINLKERGMPTPIITRELEPEKTSFVKEVGRTTGETFTGLFGQMLRNVRAATHVVAAPLAGFGAMIAPEAAKGVEVSPSEAIKESLNMARNVATGKEDIDVGVNKAAEMYYKSRRIGKYGGEPVRIKDVAAITALGFFNMFGDPVFEAGLGLRGIKASKQFYKNLKSPKPTAKLPKKTIPIDKDLSVKISPEAGELTVKNYKKNFPKQGRLPNGRLHDETQELIMSTRKAVGGDVTAKFVGDDLVIKPRVVKDVKPVRITKQMNVKTLSDIKNSLAKQPTGIKPKSIERATREIKAGKARPVRIRKLEDGSLFIEDGRHTLEASRKLGLDKIDVDDVTKFYEPPTSGIIKKSKLGLGVKEKAIEAGLVKRMQNLPEYEQISMKTQAKLATKLIEEDPARALKIAKGEELPPEGLLPESVFVAVEQQALKNGESQILRELSKSKTVSEATVMGQRIRALGERESTSALDGMKEVLEARADRFVKKGKSIEIEKRRIANDIKKELKRAIPKKDAWESFIDELTC